MKLNRRCSIRFHLLVPGRVVADADRDAQLVGQLLQLKLPQPGPITVAATAVGGDEDFTRRTVTLLAQVLPPAAQTVHRKLGGVGTDSHAHPCLVVSHIVDPVRGDPTQLALEVVSLHRLRIALGEGPRRFV